MLQRTSTFSRHPRRALATDGTIGDDCVVPHCYHALTSSPEETAGHIRACVDHVGRPGQVRFIGKDAAGRVHSLVYYRERGDADSHLNQITECLRSKGHEVHLAEVLEEVDDYPPFATNESEEST